MYFQSDDRRYQILARLSLIALYILLAYDFAVIAIGYFLAQYNSPNNGGTTIVRNVVFLIAIVDLIAMFLVRRFMLNKAVQKIDPGEELNENLLYKKLLHVTLVIAIMCSAISTYGLILMILGEKFEILMLFVAISLIGYQFFRLRPRDFKDDTGQSIE